MLVINGTRKIAMTVRVLGAKDGMVKIRQTIAAEGEILRESELLLNVGETITQDYVLTLNDYPLTELDRLVLLAEPKPFLRRLADWIFP
jgi:hypothetical protein